MRIKRPRSFIPFDGLIGHAAEHEQITHGGETINIVRIEINRALAVVLGKVKVLASEINPSKDLLALTIGLIQADTVLGQFKNAVKRRIGPAHIPNPLLRKQMGQYPMGNSVVGVELDSILKTAARLGLRRYITDWLSNGAQQIVISQHVCWRLSSRSLGTNCFQSSGERADERANDIVLDCEHLLLVTIVSFSPKMIAGFDVYELDSDADAGPKLSDASFDNVLSAEFAAYRSHINALTPELERCVSREHG
jgi:hypothetical protein